MRVKFNQKGEQIGFLKKVLVLTNCPSLKELSVRMSVPYSTLKNYFNGSRCLPENLFNDLCFVSKINKSGLKFSILSDNWGQAVGGKVRKESFRNV